MSEIEFISANKPDIKKAAELLGPILYDALIKKRLAERNECSCCKPIESKKVDSGSCVESQSYSK